MLRPGRRRAGGFARLACLGALAACGPAPTVVRLTIDVDPALAVDGLTLTAGAAAPQDLAFASELRIRVPDDWAGVVTTFALDGRHGATVVAAGAVTVTPQADAEVTAQIALVPLSCAPICALGAARCAGDAVETCARDAEGCPAWSAAVACPASAPICSNGACGTTCADECTAGATTCDGAGGQRTCANVDANACVEWGPTEACGAAEVCAAEACVSSALLTVTRAGAGRGTVTSAPAGIDCGAACSARYVIGATVRLTATPAAAATFAGWSGGGCSGTGACTVTLAAAINVTATFDGSCDACAVESWDSNSGVTYVAVDDTHVYWTSFAGRRVLRRAKAGGATEQVATGQMRPYGIALDATHVYWTNTGGEVMRKAKAGGAVETFATGQGDPFGVAVDATHVYWANSASGLVMRRAKAGGAVETLATGQGTPWGIAVDESHVYWANNAGQVRRAPKAGGATEPIASAQSSPTDVTVDATHVYWTGAAEVMRRAKAGGPVEVVASGQGNANGLTVDATHVYWTDGARNTVMRRAKAGGALQTLASDQGGAFGVALDATHVYWTNDGPNTVNRLSRCACGL